MPTKPIDRLLFAQGGQCFFCQKALSPGEASVEHLVASANGGANDADNCVICCKALNSLFGRMSIKEKIRVVLNQKGTFKCPNGMANTLSKTKSATASSGDRLGLVIADLHKRGSARPRTLKTLASTIGALFGKALPEKDIEALIHALQASRAISISGTKVTYEIPPPEGG